MPFSASLSSSTKNTQMQGIGRRGQAEVYIKVILNIVIYMTTILSYKYIYVTELYKDKG